MHALTVYIHRAIRERNPDPKRDVAWLTNAADLSRSHAGKLYKDDRPKLPGRPHERTIDALAKAFGVDRQVIEEVVVEAMYPAEKDPNEPPNLSSISNDLILEQLRVRLAWYTPGGEPLS